MVQLSSCRFVTVTPSIAFPPYSRASFRLNAGFHHVPISLPSVRVVPMSCLVHALERSSWCHPTCFPLQRAVNGLQVLSLPHSYILPNLSEARSTCAPLFFSQRCGSNKTAFSRLDPADSFQSAWTPPSSRTYPYSRTPGRGMAPT